MSLKINTIHLKNFRNYPSFELSDIGALTIFTGPNAIGKTNIIEAVQLMTSLSSLKNATAKQLVRWDEESSRVEVGMTDGGRLLSARLDIFDNKKHYSLNDKKKQPKSLRGLLPSVLFYPDDLSLIKGSQSIKRASIDHVGVQLSPNYHVIKKDYERMISHKNSLLKDECDISLLESVNETLLTIGTQLYCYRSSLFERLIPFIRRFYTNIAHDSENIEVSYIPSWVTHDSELFNTYHFSKDEAYTSYAAELERRRGEELKRKRSLVGPHADKIEFFINGKNASLYGSQGQQRSLVLSFKLAEVEVIEEITHQKPVLLLDDVMSELDEKRRNSLMDFLDDDIQTFITTTHLDYFSPHLLEKARVVDLEKNFQLGG